MSIRRLGIVSVFCLMIICIFHYTLIINSYLRNDNNNNYYVYNVDFPTSSKCETIHVGIVCTGYKQNLKLYILLKSIFLYRNQPLHFHLMVDDISRVSAETLFTTWNVPQVNVTFYNETKYKSNVDWATNSYYLHANGFMKLLLANNVPVNVTSKLVIIDTDLTFSADIYELWSLFEKFNDKQAIGLTQEQSPQKSESNKHGSNANRFDTGVTLYHLERLVKMNWTTTWMAVAEQVIKDVLIEKQDILNFILKSNSTLIYFIPCEWNIPLTTSSDSVDCYLNNQVKAVHRNFLNNSNMIYTDASSFSSMHKMVLQYNGNMLRQELPHCEPSKDPSIISMSKESKDMCSKFEKEISLNRRTLLYFRDFEYRKSELYESDVTFASQFSFEKLELVEELCGRWRGPVSLTIYVSDDEFEKTVSFIANSNYFKYRSNVAWNAVFKEGTYFPINDLRNVSLHTVVTPYVFLVDMDLIPPDTLYTDIKIFMAQINPLDKKAFVIPAFETKTDLPNTKEEVLDMLEKETLTIFHKEFIVAYGPTNYTLWKTAEVAYTVPYEVHFEPYIVVKSDIIEYDRRFIGHGFNKASHAMHLDALGYEFIVLPDVFIVHKYHETSLNLREDLHSPVYRKCKVQRMNKFVEELFQKYNKTYKIR